MPERERFLNALTVVALLSCIVTLGFVAKRELAPRRTGDSDLQKPKPVRNWQQYIATGRLLGPANAPLTLIEFADFQCPACRSLNTMLQKLRKEHPGAMAVSYHYAPLPYHQLAYPAAKAAECAAAQGKFEPYHDALFANFDSLTAASFAHIAAQVNMPDLAAFAACMNQTDSVARINADRALSFETLQIRGTPTLIVNGMMYAFAPPPGDLKKMIAVAEAAGVKR